MGCCESFSKILLILFNTIFFIIGGIILGVGIWVKVDKSNLFEMMRSIKLDDTAASFSNTNASVLDTIAIVLIVLGTFTFVTGFCGCCGAIKESPCLLYTYSFLVSVVVIAEIGIGIYAGVEQNNFKTKLQKSLFKILQKDFDGVLAQNASMFTKVFTGIMFELKCCGVNNESDFKNIGPWQQMIGGVRQVHPIGCCKLKGSYEYKVENKLKIDEFKKYFVDEQCPVRDKTELNPDGCVDTIINLIKKNLAIVIGCCVGLGLFEILCIVFACCVARKND